MTRTAKRFDDLARRDSRFGALLDCRERPSNEVNSNSGAGSPTSVRVDPSFFSSAKTSLTKVESAATNKDNVFQLSNEWQHDTSLSYEAMLRSRFALLAAVSW
jgi:hypothetical protein